MYLDNVTLNGWSVEPSETVLLYVPGGVSPILNDRGEELHGANLRVAFGKVPNAQRLFGGCSHGTLPRVAPGGEPRRNWTAAVCRALAGTAGAGRDGRGLWGPRGSGGGAPTRGGVGG